MWNDSTPQLGRLAGYFLRQFGGNPTLDTLEESMQEFWILQVERKCRVNDEDQRLTVEAVRLMKRVCGSVVRQQRHHSLFEETAAELAGHDADPLDACIQAEVIEMVRAALGEMDAQDRYLLIEHHAKGVLIKDLAKRQGRTPDAVTMHLHGARGRLRQRLSRADLMFDR